MKYLLTLLLLVAGVANAAPLTITFSWPTQHVDGTPIPTTGPGKLTSARLEFGTCTGAELDVFGVVQGQFTVPYPLTTVTGEVGTGIKCVRGFANTDLNVESRASNLGRYYPAPAPTTLTSTTKVAYEMRRIGTSAQYEFVAVGTVPVGARCGPHLAGPYATIAGAKFTKPLKGGVIAARCS